MGVALRMETKARLIQLEELELLFPGEPYFLELPVAYAAYKKSRWVLYGCSFDMDFGDGEPNLYRFYDRDGSISKFVGNYNEYSAHGWRLWLGAPTERQRMDIKWGNADTSE